jgi:hypothetical protein
MSLDRPTCPVCESSHIAKIEYGLPDFSEELERELDAKRVVLGGCVVTGDDPQWHCNECHHRWGSCSFEP